MESRRLARSPETTACGDMASRALLTRVRPIILQPALGPLHGHPQVHRYAPTTHHALPIHSAYSPKPTNLDANAAILRRWSDVYSGSQPGLPPKRTMLTADKP
jgi:hypothetical protein